MTNEEKRQALVNKVISREGKNKYTQTDKRDQVASGYSDCSSLTGWAHKEVLGINIGSNTEAQIKSSKLTTIDVSIKDGIHDESKMLPGDLLYFRGKDTDRKDSQYVGHVEMYIGNGEIMGHGSGVGPTRKNMVEYCRQRQKSSSPVPAGNRGLICVRRAVVDPMEEQATKEETSVAANDNVAKGQEWLNDYYGNQIKKYTGAELKVDNSCGPKTRAAAVCVWKDVVNRKYGFSLTPSNENFYDNCKVAARKANIKKGDSGTLVLIAKLLLSAEGYYTGKMTSDFGSDLETAVEAFQRASGLKVDGVIGSNTWYALFN